MELTRLPNGLEVHMANLPETLFLYQEIFVRRLYAQAGIRVPAGGRVVDVGANIGLFSLSVCQGAPDVTVVAVEPIPSTADILRANVRRHAMPVTVVECALGSADGTLELGHYPGMTMMSGAAADPVRDLAVVRGFLTLGGTVPLPPAAAMKLGRQFAMEKVTVRVRRLSEVLREQGVTRVDLLKVDVERAELDVLRGVDAGDWPAVAQAVVEVHDEDGRLQGVLGVLEGAGFHCDVQREPSERAVSNCTVYARR
jgi:FkbM family methyltransferase